MFNPNAKNNNKQTKQTGDKEKEEPGEHKYTS